MLNKIVSIVLVVHCVILLILGNIKDNANVGLGEELIGTYNKSVMCLTFLSLLYMMTLVCNKTLSSVGGVPTVLLFGLSFICSGINLLFIGDKNNDLLSLIKIIINAKNKTPVFCIIGGITSIVSIILGIVLVLSSCKK
jgi:hypothetical protein